MLSPEQLRVRGRKLDRLNVRVARARRAMHRGAILHLQYTPTATWRLSNGRRLDGETARILLISDPQIEPRDRSLFPNITHPQTFQYKETRHG
jgi:hypothetical protein